MRTRLPMLAAFTAVSLLVGCGRDDENALREATTALNAESAGDTLDEAEDAHAQPPHLVPR